MVVQDSAVGGSRAPRRSPELFLGTRLTVIAGPYGRGTIGARILGGILGGDSRVARSKLRRREMLKGWVGKVDRRARAPSGIRIYAIGDIHGCADLLERAFAFIDNDIEGHREKRIIHVCLGDYVDRGPDSRRTLNLLIARSRNHETVFVRGNHEQLMQDFLSHPSVLSDWWSMGGAPTLISYGLMPASKSGPAEAFSLRDALASAMPSSHHVFLGSLRSAFTCGDFFFTHAGIRPGVALDLQRQDDLMWIREPFLNSHQYFGKMVVHGHTPVPQPEFHNNRINIDTGAYATGCLSVLSIEDYQLGVHFVRRSGVTTQLHNSV